MIRQLKGQFFGERNILSEERHPARRLAGHFLGLRQSLEATLGLDRCIDDLARGARLVSARVRH